MAIPTKEMFDSFKIDNQWVVNENWKVEKFSNKELVREEVSIILREWHQQQKLYLNKINEHALVKTLESQPNWKKAEESLFYRRSKKTKQTDNETYQEKLLNDILKKDKYFKYLHHPAWSAAYKLNSLIEKDPYDFVKGIYGAFYTYFYTDKWKNVTYLALESKAIVMQANHALANLIRLEVLNEFNDRNAFIGKNSVGHSINRIKYALDEFLKDEDFFYVPIKRNDATLKERGLVYDLSTVFRRKYKSNKAKAIYSFLMIEGIENNLELRTIERLLSNWKEVRSARWKKDKAKRQLESEKA